MLEATSILQDQKKRKKEAESKIEEKRKIIELIVQKLNKIR
jgi:hypothetical protein